MAMASFSSVASVAEQVAWAGPAAVQDTRRHRPERPARTHTATKGIRFIAVMTISVRRLASFEKQLHRPRERQGVAAGPSDEGNTREPVANRHSAHGSLDRCWGLGFEAPRARRAAERPLQPTAAPTDGMRQDYTREQLRFLVILLCFLPAGRVARRAADGVPSGRRTETKNAVNSRADRKCRGRVRIGTSPSPTPCRPNLAKLNVVDDSCDNEGGRFAIAGLVYQAIGVAGLFAAARLKLEPDRLDGILSVTHEKHGQDAVVEGKELTGRRLKELIQFKFSLGGTRPIQPKELYEIVDGFANSEQAACQLGGITCGFRLVTNRPLSPGAKRKSRRPSLMRQRGNSRQ